MANNKSRLGHSTAKPSSPTKERILTDQEIAKLHFECKHSIASELIDLFKTALTSAASSKIPTTDVAYLKDLNDLKPEMETLNKTLQKGASYSKQSLRSLTGNDLDKIQRHTKEIRIQSVAAGHKFLKIIPDEEKPLIGDVATTLCAIGEPEIAINTARPGAAALILG